MRHISIPAAVVALLCFASCKKAKVVEFDLQYQSSFQIVGSSQAGENFFQSTPDIATNTAQKFTDNNTSAELVDSAFITLLRLTITFPSAENFDLVDTIGASLTAAGLTELKVVPDAAHANDASKIYTFATTKVNIKEFIKGTAFKARFYLSLDENPLNNITIDVELEATVYARENE
jgi:hypothetical protein